MSQNCYLWRSFASPHTTLLLDLSGSSSSKFLYFCFPARIIKVKLSTRQTFTYTSIQILVPVFPTQQSHQIQKIKWAEATRNPPWCSFILSQASLRQETTGTMQRPLTEMPLFLVAEWELLFCFLKHTIQLILPWNAFRQINKPESANLCNPFHQIPLTKMCTSFPKP